MKYNNTCEFNVIRLTRLMELAPIRDHIAIVITRLKTFHRSPDIHNYNYKVLMKYLHDYSHLFA